MPTVDLHALNQLILRLYRDGREVPLPSFQAWALDQLRGAIPFDSAWWGNAAANPPALHEVHLDQCDRAIIDAYPPYVEEDFFRRELIARPGRSVNMSDLTTRALRAHLAVSGTGTTIQGGVVAGHLAHRTDLFAL